MIAASAMEVNAMNAWAAQAAAALTADARTDALHERMSALGAFGMNTFPRVVHALPVLYMFSGSDLLTAMALFPTAPEYHLVADFAPGHPACFLDAACIAQANETTTAFFRHWASLRYARQSTNLMRRAFATATGQLPALLVSLHLIGLPVLHATTRSVDPPVAHAATPTRVSAKHLVAGRIHGRQTAASGGELNVSSTSTRAAQIPSVTLHTARCRVSYHSLLLRSDPSEHVRLSKQDWPVFKRWERGGAYVDAQLRALATAVSRTSDVGMVPAANDRTTPPDSLLAPSMLGASSWRPVVSMFKAAPHWILRNAWMASWVLGHSAATLHDETGLRPLFYNATAGATTDRWRVVTRGRFADFENREVKWYPGEKEQLKTVFRGPELPFQFGYAQHGGLGVLLAAWRDGL